jgi:hypothetical protein
MKEEISEQGAIPDDLKDNPKPYSTSTNFILIEYSSNLITQDLRIVSVHLSPAEEELLPILIKYVLK